MISPRSRTLATCGLAAILLCSFAQAQGTARLSTDAAGVEGNGLSIFPSISGNGRYVAFTSAASNLVSGDTNGVDDAFVKDRRTGEVWRVSVDSAGNQANGRSTPTSITPDGRYVAFASDATNLVAGDTNGAIDCFVHDRTSGTTVRASIRTNGVEGNDDSSWGSLSDDGSLVAFSSIARNLVNGDRNREEDVFVRDLQAGTTQRVSVSSAGIEGDGLCTFPDLSGDGRFVSFLSRSTNLVPGDLNGSADTFLHELATGATTRLSVDSAGVEGNQSSYKASLSRDGRYAVFHSFATNLVPGDTNGQSDIFLRDLQTGTIERISLNDDGTQGDGFCYWAAISADGQRISYSSDASTLVPGDTNGIDDTFLHDRASGRTTRVSVGTGGVQGNDRSQSFAISDDGRYVPFLSEADNLVTGDTNDVSDAFVHGPSLTLEISAPSATAGDSIRLDTWGGRPGGVNLLVVDDIDGTPRFTILAVGPFDQLGERSLAGTVPSGLAGIAVTFRSYGFTPTGKVGASDRQSIRFE